MAPEFISEFEITYGVYLDWVRHPLGKKARRNRMKRLVWKMAGLLISAFLIVLGISIPDNAAMFIGIAFSGAMLYLVFLYPNTAAKNQYKKAIAENDSHPWIRTLTFTDVIKMSDFRTQAEYKYSQATHLSEDNQYLYLWLGSDFVLRVLKSGFTKGSPQALAGFIESKMKKTKKSKKSR